MKRKPREIINEAIGYTDRESVHASINVKMIDLGFRCMFRELSVPEQREVAEYALEIAVSKARGNGILGN